MDAETDFYASIPIVDDFAAAVRAENYLPVPDDWQVGFCDVVGSTQAVAAGRYKAVNMVGAGAIAAVANAIDRRPFPFVFGGDGASFAVSGADAPAAAEALAAMAIFAQEQYGLELRVAMTPVSAVRAAGRDVLVARFGASPHCAYAMFAGGGLSWVEAHAKRGEFALAPAVPGTWPDLAGLSCRWGVAPARHGIILSVIVAPREDDPRFPALVEEIARMALSATDGGRPITLATLQANRRPGNALRLEAVAVSHGGSKFKALLTTTLTYLMGLLFNTLKLKAGGFDAAVYLSDVAANADFRKFDDGLRMTLDCSPEFADALERRLEAASAFAEYGCHRQASAQLTCYTPSILDRGHVHFVDGAEGGYTMAAKAMKARRAPVEQKVA